jgi:PEP-CTERM motif-containing protein
MMMGLGGMRGWSAAIVALAALSGQAARAQSSVPEAQLETFLGLNTGSGLGSGDLTNLGNGPVMNGSAIMQSINVTAGETLSFSYNFLTNAPSPASNPLGALDPFAFVTQPTLTDFADNFSTLTAAPPQSGFLYQTGIQTFSETFTTGGTGIMFGIGVVDVTTDQYSSALDVSNFALSSGSFSNGWSTLGNVSGGPGGFVMSTSVPEPSSIILLVLGGLGVGIACRHRKLRSFENPR